MILNDLERRLVNSWPRAFLQKHLEAAWMRKVGGPVVGRERDERGSFGSGVALEIGCGRGVGIEIILETFGAIQVHGFDLDPAMLGLAAQRLARYGARVELWEGNALAIPSEEAAFDAVFCFAILHHIDDWRAALREIRRVLRPGGCFYVSEVLEDFITHPVWRRLFDHPQEGRFSARVFQEALSSEGFTVLGARDLWGQVGAFVARREG